MMNIIAIFYASEFRNRRARISGGIYLIKHNGSEAVSPTLPFPRGITLFTEWLFVSDLQLSRTVASFPRTGINPDILATPVWRRGATPPSPRVKLRRAPQPVADCGDCGGLKGKKNITFFCLLTVVQLA